MHSKCRGQSFLGSQGHHARHGLQIRLTTALESSPAEQLKGALPHIQISDHCLSTPAHLSSVHWRILGSIVFALCLDLLDVSAASVQRKISPCMLLSGCRRCTRLTEPSSRLDFGTLVLVFETKGLVFGYLQSACHLSAVACSCEVAAGTKSRLTFCF